jgi:tagatose 1,6-diphosphate aldolase
MGLSWGKAWSLRRLADENGRFKMLAIDQRPPIAQLVAKGRGIPASNASFSDICDVKKLLAESLAAHATAVLVDPNFGYPAAIDSLRPSSGLIMTLEDHRFAEEPGGRRSDSIADWSVEKIRRIGADGVKVLAWYRPDADPEIRKHQQDYVATVGKACAKQDIPFILELLTYPLLGTAGHTPDYIEDRNKRPSIVLDSVLEFADPRYGVDLFKLESPVAASDLPKADDTAGAEALRAAFAELTQAAGRPWVLLSAGAGMDDFARTLACACDGGASGFLAGRAIWWSAMQDFPMLEACAEKLRAVAVPYMQALGRLTDSKTKTRADENAPPAGVRVEGDFARQYPRE